MAPVLTVWWFKGSALSSRMIEFTVQWPLYRTNLNQVKKVMDFAEGKTPERLING